MAILGAGVQQLILLVLLATFIHLLLPSSELERYAQLVLGLTIVWAILQWLVSWFDHDAATLRPAVLPSEAAAPVVGPAMQTLQQVRSQTVSRQAGRAVAMQLRHYLEGRFPMMVEAQVEVEAASPQITRVQLYLTPRQGERLPAMQPAKEVVSIEPVQPMAPKRVNPANPAGGEEEPIRRAAAEWLQIPIEYVEVALGGRGQP